MKKDLSNRYTDLDQRLELLNQKVDPESAQSDNPTNSDTPATASTETPAVENKVVNAAPTGTPSTTPPPQPEASQPPSQNQSNPIELEKAAYTVALDAYKQGGAKKRLLQCRTLSKIILIASIQGMHIFG